MLGHCSKVGKTIAERSFSTSSSYAFKAIDHVTVVGGGLMGSGIAQVAAQHGNKVNLIDVNEDVLKKSQASITQSLQRVAKKQFKGDPSKTDAFVEDIMSRLNFSVDLIKAVEKSDLVVEAIVEKIDIKLKLFASIDKVAPEHTIFASNTSSIPIKEIAAASTRKDRFGGLHFFNPVPMMKLLEVIRIPETSDETFRRMEAWGLSIGKVTVTCKDTPGFIVNRLLIPYTNEAIRMYERGDATVEDIDTAMKLGAGYPMGPFELTDYTGGDLALSIGEGWEKRFPDKPEFKVSELIRKMVKEGKFGKKSGEGFYKYNK
jgi:3-hydroxyacyl-CoA dehydrogenase